MLRNISQNIEAYHKHMRCCYGRDCGLSPSAMVFIVKQVFKLLIDDLNDRNVYKGVKHTLNQFKGGLMTKKISKKDKLDAMLQMWTVLRHENRSKPFASISNNFKIMAALQTELADTLGVKQVNDPLLPKDQIVLLVERLKQVQGELRTLKTEANARYGGSKILDALIGMLEDKLKPAVPVPANFENELSSPESAE